MYSLSLVASTDRKKIKDVLHNVLIEGRNEYLQAYFTSSITDANLFCISKLVMTSHHIVNSQYKLNISIKCQIPSCVALAAERRGRLTFKVK